jgi:hypothetical protein
MDRLPHEPKNFRDIVEADLRRAARLVVKVQDEIDPQFRFATPEGDFHLPVTMPADLCGRKVIFRNLALLFAWKQTFGYTLASELHWPDSVLCVGFMGKERYACLARITRHPKPWTATNFGPVEWLPNHHLDDDKWFGAYGKFPAMKIATGELGI